MRRPTPVVTLGLCAQGATAAKRQAQERLAALVMQTSPTEAA
jgi:hypothetical protein